MGDCSECNKLVNACGGGSISMPYLDIVGLVLTHKFSILYIANVNY